MEIDYSKIDENSVSTIRTVEGKPHVRYIRYLLTKRYSPIVIKKELQRLGLSAPHEPVLIKYYLEVIDPLVKKYKLGAIYSEYKNKLLTKGKQHSYSKELLNYKLHLGDKPDLQVAFCKFVTELETDAIWISEVMRFYGSAGNIPTDENGNRVIKTTSYKRKLDTILTCPKRYLIDKMILENVPDMRIAEYFRKNFKMVIYDYDIAQYKEVFFNLRTFDIEDKLASLEIEKKNLEGFLDVLDSDSVIDLGEKIMMKSQTEKRIAELDENIKTLNMLYSEAAYGQAKIERDNFIDMFQDIVKRSYNRFAKLDNCQDRDVVEPLFKVTRMMGYAYEKVSEIAQQGNSGGDKHSQFELMKLYRKQADEAYQKQIEDNDKKRELAGDNVIDDNINVSDIRGVEELNIMEEIDDHDSQGN